MMNSFRYAFRYLFKSRGNGQLLSVDTCFFDVLGSFEALVKDGYSTEWLGSDNYPTYIKCSNKKRDFRGGYSPSAAWQSSSSFTSQSLLKRGGRRGATL